MIRPFFITIEGVNFSGKTTVTKGIMDWMESQNYEAVLTREPYDEYIRDLLLSNNNFENQREYMLLGDRVNHVSSFIRPALTQGVSIICDRYYDSMALYQSKSEEDVEKIIITNEILTGNMVPDLTLWIDISYETMLKRVSYRYPNVEMMNSFEKRLLDKDTWDFLYEEIIPVIKIAGEKRIVSINGNCPPTTVYNSAIMEIKKYLRLPLDKD